MATCKSCGAAIVWYVTTNNKAIPLDEGTVENGNIKVVGNVATVVNPGQGDRVSHFVTCANARQHRKRRA